MKKYDNGHLEEIEVHRDDQQLYTFKEGDFKRLRLQDIEDMLLLLIQQKLTNLTIYERYDLNVALHFSLRHCCGNKNGLFANEEIEQLRQEKGSGYSSGYKQAALSEEVDAKSRDVHWWKNIRERSQASGKDNMTSSYSVSTNFRDYTHFYQLFHSELVDIENVAVRSSLRSLKPKVHHWV
nr:hypothetical protein [Tanacetum cinerariifolium]